MISKLPNVKRARYIIIMGPVKKSVLSGREERSRIVIGNRMINLGSAVCQRNEFIDGRAEIAVVLIDELLQVRQLLVQLVA